jgi:hypothetical protein
MLSFFFAAREAGKAAAAAAQERRRIQQSRCTRKHFHARQSPRTDSRASSFVCALKYKNKQSSPCVLSLRQNKAAQN